MKTTMKPNDFKRPVMLILGVLLAGVLVAPATLAQVKSADDIVYPPLIEIEVPQPQRVELDNGMVVIMLEDHELPLIDVQALIATGSQWEPADKVGLADLAGRVLRSGGTQKMASDALDDYLEDRAASIESTIGVVNGNLRMSSLRDDFPEMLQVFSDVLRLPAFEEDKIEVAKTETVSGISRQNDDANQIAGREFRELIYGSDSPYARQATYATIDNISRDDLVAWHAKYYHPDRVILGLVGDFESKQALELIEKVFGDWPRGPKIEDGEVAYNKEPTPGVFFVEKNDVTQSAIRLGHLGIRRDNPDYYAVDMMNQVLGGSFAARLFSRVRSQKGLAYNVNGGVGSRWDHPGIFQMGMNTKTETTAAGIDALLEELDNMTSEPPTDEEVAKAKLAVLNSFVFRADSAAEILGQQLTYEYFGYPLDWQARYRKGIEAVTTEEVRAAARKYLHRDRLTFLVVGPTEGVDRPLSDFGAVQNVDITIPEPEVETVAATEEGSAKGRELIAKAVASVGGAERLASFKTYRSEMSVEATTPQGAMQVKAKATIVLPDRMRWEMVMPFGTMVQVLNGDDSFAQTPGGTGPLPAAQRADLKKTLRRLLPVLLKHHDAEGFEAVAAGSGDVDGTAVEKVQVTLDGEVNTLAIDPESGRVLSLEYAGTNMMGARGQIVQRYSDYREVDGLTLPFSSVTTFNDEPMLSGAIDSTVVDGEIADTEFAKPAG
ncbi:MAG: pitrilysin family protein [Acidobacteriota bacterium]